MLLKGDCLIEMNKIADGSVDMILADLPYGTTACKWDNVIPFEPLWKHYWRVLKPNGAVVLFGSEPFSSHLRMSQIKHYKYDWIWIKERASDFFAAKYKPLCRHELISVFSKAKVNTGAKIKMTYEPTLHIVNKVKKNGKSVGGQLGIAHKISMAPNKTYVQKYTNYPHTDIYFANGKKGHHPTQKPVALLEYLIKTYTLEGETVLDNTMGSGSTGVACVNTGRKFIGIEQDDKYFEIAQKRIAEAQQPRELWS